jgi:hypothetical protein
MESDADRWGSVATHQPVCDFQTKKDGLAWVRDAQHERVADGLHMSGAGRQLGPDRVAEVRDQGCCFLVAVGFGQGSEAGDVGEEEGGRELGQRAEVSYSSTLKVKLMFRTSRIRLAQVCLNDALSLAAGIVCALSDRG